MLHEQAQPPVSAVKIDSDCMWHSPSANNLPFWPQVPALPNTAQHVPAVMAHLIGAIQSNAMKNPVRTFVFNYLSRNRYNNQDFIDLLSMTVGYFEILLTYTQNGRATDPNSAAVQASADYSKIIAAMLVRAYPQLQQYQNGEMIHEMNVCLEHHERVQQQVAQARQQSGAHVVAPVSGNSMSTVAQVQTPAQVGRAAPIIHAGDSVNGQSWGNPGDPLRGPDGLTPYERMTGQRSADLSGMHGLSHQEPFTNLGIYARTEPAIDSPGGSSIPGIVSGGLKPRPTHITKTEVSFDEEVPTIRVVEMPPAQLPALPVKLQPDPSAQLDTTYLHQDDGSTKGDFGETVELAQASTMRPTSNNRLVYDPTKYTVCYQKLSDGTVCLVLADKEGDMSWNYQEHELDMPTVQDQVAPPNPNAPKVGLTAEGLANIKRTEDELEELRKTAVATRSAQASDQVVDEETSADIDIGEAGVITNQTIFFAHSHREATMIAGLAILKLDRDGSSVNEYFYQVVRPITPENTTLVLKDMEKILEEPIAYERAFMIIGNRIKEGKDLAFWKEVDNRVTECFMGELHASMSLSNDWSITSFSEDYADLIEALAKRFSPNFIDTVEASAKTVLIRALDLLTEEQQSDYINGLVNWGGTISDELVSRMLVLSEFCCAVEIPVKTDDIKPFLETGILPEEAVSFHKLISGVVNNAYKVAPDECPRIFLRLADQALFEVHASRMVDDVYVLRPVQPATQY